MSYGGSSSKKSDEFGRAIAKIAVAQICDSVGFHGSHNSALNVLSDVAVRFIQDLGKAANSSAISANRSESNVFDLIQGLEDLGFAHGFAGASNVRRCLVSSGVVRDIIKFVNTEDEVPFARSVPKFPVARDRKPGVSFSQTGDKPDGDWEHIPIWLPPFPDLNSYTNTPVCEDRENEIRAERIEQERQRRKAEESLLGLQRRLICNGEAGPMLPAADIIVRNPFFMPPLAYGEKPVSDIVVPGPDDLKEKSISVLETIVPLVEAEREGDLEIENSENRDLHCKRPKVRFRLGTEKRTLPLSSETSGRKDSWWLRDDEKDDRKKRAGKIVLEAMENGKKLIQM